MTTKYIIVTGGVLSGLGKGITASSIGKLLKDRGYEITAIKIDPYLNCDAGTMNPYQHGEVFVLEDGAEVDLDLGHYERFLDINLTAEHNITTGKVYKSVIEKERRGRYLGKTVQIIPHVTNEIKSQIKSVAKSKPKKDIVIIELGGTVGDIESMPFLEAVRQLHREIGDNNCIFVHTTLIPVLKTVGEQKTKPTQHSVKELRAIGIQPDVIICRSSRYLEKDIKEKISLFCDVQLEAVISAPDVECIYQIPLIFEEQGLTDFLLNRFQLPTGKHDLTKWREFVDSLLNPMRETNIALVGKYTHLKDSYLSHIETLKHCGAKLKTRINIIWIEARDSNIEKALAPLKKAEGIIVPGGFGRRGIECKIAAIKYARENNIPFLGICLGFQLAVIEFCRNVLNMDTANSTEFNPNTKYPVIDLLPEQRNVKNLGGTMRLGVYPTKLKNDSISHKLYNTTEIFERHRHRYEVNPEYVDLIESAGLKFVGKSFDDKRMEIAELENHNFFIAVQFHPEFKSRPDKPSPLYLGLVSATSNRPL